MFELAKGRAQAQSSILSERSPRARQVSAQPDSDAPEAVTTFHSGLPLTFEGGLPVVAAASASQTIQYRFKRVIDILVASTVLVVFAPVFLAVALAITLSSPGPVLFRQKREGVGGEPIGIYKFRTMYVDRCDVTGITQTIPADPRITGIGRFLRRTSIDELPQLLNVLKGEMSLIGPRPHAFGMLAANLPYERLVPYYRVRHIVRPGISGWAQAHGYRGPTNNAEAARARIDHDLAYIANFSLILDLKIIWKTLRQEFPNGTGL